MYCTFKDQISSLNQVSTQDQLLDFYRKNCFINFFIRSENLEIELLDAIMNCHLEISDSKKFRISNSPKTNTSSRGDYQKYYNQELINLVQERDSLIIDSFNYEF
jgi:hypothetical protein